MSKSASKWWNIRKLTAVAAAAAGMQVAAAAEIYIYGDIGESYWEETVSARTFLAELNAVDAEAITVRINSIGGSVPDGLAIYNAIKRHKATVTTVVDGMALSVASLIAMAGDKREMAANAMLMLHAPWTYIAGNSADLRVQADVLDTWAAAMATSYAAASGKPQEACMALLSDGKDHYYTAEEAKAEGFIDAITDAQEPAAMAMAQRVLGVSSRYPTAPAAWLQANGAAAAAPAAAISAASAAPTQENAMNLRKFSLLAGLLMMAAGENGSPAGSGGQGGGAPAPAPAAGTEGGQPVAAGTQTREQILAAERQRTDAIDAKAKPFASHPGVADLVAKAKANHNVTADTFGAQLLDVLGQATTPVAGGRGAGGLETVEDERDKFVRAASESILARAGIVARMDGDKDKAPTRVVATTANPMRGRKLLAIAEACLIRAGVRTEGMDQRAIVAAAFTQSTSDFPVLLENVMHKTLQGAYAIQAAVWPTFCARGEVSDFRAHNRYRTGSLGNLQPKNELGEYKNVSIPDAEKAQIAAATKGFIINISREAVINDDLGYFLGLAKAAGSAAKRTVEVDVFAALADNAGMGPTLEDGKSLFHADHANVSTGANTVDNWEAARVVMRAQKDVAGVDYLSLDPAIWLGPDGKVGAAKVVNNSTFDPDTANKLQRANIANAMVKAIVSTPRLTGTPWYFFADPAQAPVLEVAFLDGIDEPYIELENAFNTDGARWKVRMDYGVAGVDFRGAVRSTGA